MTTMLQDAPAVKESSAERLAELGREMDAAQRANDPTAWLRAWHEADDLRVAQFLAECPPWPDDDEPIEDWGPAEAWPAGEWDDVRWEDGPEGGPAAGPTPVGLALADALKAIAARYRAVPSGLGELMAEQVEDLLAEVEITKAATVDQLRVRRAALLGACEARGAAPPRGRPDDCREPRGTLAGHPDRYGAYPEALA